MAARYGSKKTNTPASPRSGIRSIQKAANKNTSATPTVSPSAVNRRLELARRSSVAIKSKSGWPVRDYLLDIAMSLARFSIFSGRCFNLRQHSLQHVVGEIAPVYYDG